LAPESIAPAVHDVLRGVRTRVLVFSPDSARLYYAVGEQLLRWDVQAREAVGQPVEVPGGAVTALAVNRKGDRIVAGTESGAVALIDANNGRVLGSADEHGDPVTALAVSPADNFYASGSDDEEVHVYHLRTGAHAFELADVGEEVTTVRFGADGKTLVVASRDRMVRLYDVNLQKELRAFKESAKRLLFAELSRDGAWLAIAAKRVDIDLRRN
ncbi:MAG: hypothetical protein GWO39_12615, partial [Gammaproteobacteria bacterium]|nr:hypothetical protein [Gammaproteobacteria bacterium]NIT64577.1 hypothetical protein [Gammaproteobacteria bacterium]NIV21536.1 hypothetical protein [Gammaproteobacteria bacterium]NIY33157.1 hypothetical protein [Gammaproteobacteria bacterium]